MPAAPPSDASAPHEAEIASTEDMHPDEFPRLEEQEPEFAGERPGDVMRHWANTEKARRSIGFEATVSVRAGLQRYVDWIEQSEDGVLVGEADMVRNW